MLQDDVMQSGKQQQQQEQQQERMASSQAARASALQMLQVTAPTRPQLSWVACKGLI
jgi:hypothetical protein